MAAPVGASAGRGVGEGPVAGEVGGDEGYPWGLGSAQKVKGGLEADYARALKVSWAWWGVVGGRYPRTTM